MKMDSLRFVDNFIDGTRVLFLIHRNKEGGPANNSKVEKVITRNADEFREHYERMVAIVDSSETPLRVYSSVNKRNIDKAIRDFKFSMLEADYYDTESRVGFYLTVRDRFLSSLMKPSARDTSYFLVDVDDGLSLSDVKVDLSLLKVKIVCEYPTKNGHHVVCEPFNPNSVNWSDKINKDGLLLLYWKQ